MPFICRLFLLLLFSSSIPWISGSETTTALRVSKHDVDIIVGEEADIVLTLSARNETVDIAPSYNPPDAANRITRLGNISIAPSDEDVNITVSLHGVLAGHVTVVWNASHPSVSDRDAYVRINIIHSEAMLMVCVVVGWIYFFAWSISFYPQFYENFSRKSVIGLNLDYVAMNVLGHTVYGIFNIGLYWIPSVQQSYYILHPLGVNPVQLNDVIFSLHAIAASSFTAVQCCMYERGAQRVTLFARVFISLSIVLVVSTFIAAAANGITWLTVLYYCSYIKLAVTLTKYAPQAYMNYKRKSTIGWSIGGVMLDLTGGVLSVTQMFLIAVNNDDWEGIFGDPTKFGLGIFTIFFDLLFIIQHYVLYRGNIPHVMLVDPVQDDALGDEPVPEPIMA